VTLTALRLRPELLTAEAFGPFGDVIEMREGESRPINNNTCQRWDHVAGLDVTQVGGAPLLSMFRAQAATLPLSIPLLERHPLSSQAFVPLSVRPFLVVVAPAGDRVKHKDIRAFLTASGQGVNYAAGVWHAPLIALGEASDFVVIGRAGPETNCDFHHFAKPVTLAP
jgi:ureidoglycolate lyase